MNINEEIGYSPTELNKFDINFIAANRELIRQEFFEQGILNRDRPLKLDWRVSNKKFGDGTIVMHSKRSDLEGKPLYLVRFDNVNKTPPIWLSEDELEVIDWARWCDENVPGSSNSFRWHKDDYRCDNLNAVNYLNAPYIECAHIKECRHVKRHLRNCEDSRLHEKMMEERARKSGNSGYKDGTDWGKWNDSRDNDDQEEFYNQF